MNDKPSFFAELQRRHVYKVGASYCVAGWLLIQVVTQVLPVFEVSLFAQRIVVLFVIAGFPVALVLSWLFDLTPLGVVRTGAGPAAGSVATERARRTADRRLNYLLGGLVLLCLCFIAAERAGVGRAHAPATSVTSERSIAVLPFENLSDDKANAYFAVGIQDEILTRLAKIGSLLVISRTSTMQYASKPGNLSEIARQLGVANVLEGSVQRAGDTVRINVQLVKASGDAHLWAEVYDRKLDNIFGVESEVAGAIADALHAKLTGAEQADLATRPTSIAAAYDAYLRGVAFSLRADALAVNNTNAITALEETVKLDPSFAAAWAALSRQYSLAYMTDLVARHRDAARNALDTAERLAPGAPETLGARGFYLYRVERDYESAWSLFERLSRQAPNDGGARSALALIARRQGRWDQSLDLFEKALVVDPRDLLVLDDAAFTAVAMRDWRSAKRLIDRALDIAPDDPSALTQQVYLFEEQGEVERAQKILDRMRISPGDGNAVIAFVTNASLNHAWGPAIALLKAQLEHPQSLGDNLGICQQMLGDLQRNAGNEQGARSSFEAARATLGEALRVAPEDPSLSISLAWVEAGLGNQTEALRLARQAIALLPASKDAVVGPQSEDSLARLQARFGDKDSAIAALSHLIRIPYGLPPITAAGLRFDPDWDNLRDDPRLQQLITDAGKARSRPTQ